MGTGASTLTEGLAASSVAELKECFQGLDAEQRKVVLSAMEQAKQPHSCDNMPKVPGYLWELWPTLGERFGPYNFFFAEDPTEKIRAKMQVGDKFVDPEYVELMPERHEAHRIPENPKAECVWPEDGPQLHHVNQVSMPNCEFMASFACLSMYPERLKEVFANVTDGKFNELGLYTFKLTYKGRVGYMVIDDIVPGTQQCPVGAHPAHGTIWVSLLEKLTAKLSDQNYSLLEGHAKRYDAGCEFTSGMDIACLIVGGHAREVYPPKCFDLRFCDFIEFLIKEPGTIVTCAAHGGRGLAAHHAYGIGGMYTVGDIQLVKMQNPWGRGEWTGDWSDKSPKWDEHPDVAEAVCFKAENEGTFFVTRYDFIRNFTAFLFNFITPERAKDDDATGEFDEWLGEYDDGETRSFFKKSPEGGLWLDKEGIGPLDYLRGKYKYELKVKPPMGPATAFLFKRPDGTPFGYSAGLYDWNWYVGPVAVDSTLGELEIKMRNWEPCERKWEEDEKAMHWVGRWSLNGEEHLTVTGDTFDTLKFTLSSGKTYSIMPVMFNGWAVLVPHDHIVFVNVNKIQRFRREILLSQMDGEDKIYTYSGDQKYWKPEDE